MTKKTNDDDYPKIQRGIPVQEGTRLWTPDVEMGRAWGHLKNEPYIAIDTETTGLSVGRDQIRLVQVGTKDRSFTCEWNSYNANFLLGWLKSSKSTWITHNGVYDWLMIGVDMKRRGYEKEFQEVFKNLHLRDTYILGWHHDPRKKMQGGVGHGLEALTRRYIDADIADEIKGSMTAMARSIKVRKGDLFETIALDHYDYHRYASYDVFLTAELREILDIKLAETGIHSLELVDNDHEDMRCAVLMSLPGMPVSIDRLNEKGLKYHDVETKAYEKCQELGVDNPYSTKQLIEYYTNQGVVFDKFTDKGQPKVDKKFLEGMESQGDPLASLVLEAKKARKWNQTFITGILEATDPETMLAHPQINVLGAITGRYSSSGPNFQNFPSKSSEIREVFYDPNRKCVSVDYSKQELRIAGVISEDKKLYELFLSGRDPMKELAAQIYGQNYTPIQYAAAKTCVYAMLYGSGLTNMASQAGISFDEASEIKSGFYGLYVDLARYVQWIKQDAKKRGYVKGITGRLIPIHPLENFKAFNAICQNAGREKMSESIRNIRETPAQEFLRLQVHDELNFWIPEELLDTIIPIIKQAMEGEIKGMPFPTGVEIMDAWGGHYG